MAPLPSIRGRLAEGKPDKLASMRRCIIQLVEEAFLMAADLTVRYRGWLAESWGQFQARCWPNCHRYTEESVSVTWSLLV